MSNLDSGSDKEEEGEGEDEDSEGGHLVSLDPGLRIPMCIIVDEECLMPMRRDDGVDPVPFVKTVDVRLATNKELYCAGRQRRRRGVAAVLRHLQ